MAQAEQATERFDVRMARPRGGPRRHVAHATGHGIHLLPLAVIFAIVFSGVLVARGNIDLRTPSVQMFRDRVETLLHPERIRSYTAYVTDTGVNLRGAASLDAGVIDVMAEGDEVIVTGRPVDGFLPVEVGGQKGWISVDYISDDDAVAGGSASDDAAAAGEPVDAPPATDAGGASGMVQHPAIRLLVARAASRT